MKPTPFPGNGNGLIVTHHRSREGPDYFTVYYNNVSRFIPAADPDALVRVLKAKSSETGKALYAWAEEIAQANLPSQEAIPDSHFADTSFASEALKEDPDDPTANTKMVT